MLSTSPGLGVCKPRSHRGAHGPHGWLVGVCAAGSNKDLLARFLTTAILDRYFSAGVSMVPGQPLHELHMLLLHVLLLLLHLPPGSPSASGTAPAPDGSVGPCDYTLRSAVTRASVSSPRGRAARRPAGPPPPLSTPHPGYDPSGVG